MDQPSIELREAQRYLGIGGRVPAGVPAFVDKAFPELFGWLRAHEIEPAGAPFIRYLETDRAGEPVSIEAGVPVVTEHEGDGRVHADALPAGRYLTLLHVGPYRSERLPDLADARERLVSFAEEEGLTYSRETEGGFELPCVLERFLVGPVEEPDFTRWRTEFAYLLG